MQGNAMRQSCIDKRVRAVVEGLVPGREYKHTFMPVRWESVPLQTKTLIIGDTHLSLYGETPDFERVHPLTHTPFVVKSLSLELPETGKRHLYTNVRKDLLVNFGTFSPRAVLFSDTRLYLAEGILNGERSPGDYIGGLPLLVRHGKEFLPTVTR